MQLLDSDIQRPRPSYQFKNHPNHPQDLLVAQSIAPIAAKCSYRSPILHLGDLVTSICIYSIIYYQVLLKRNIR